VAQGKEAVALLSISGPTCPRLPNRRPSVALFQRAVRNTASPPRIRRGVRFGQATLVTAPSSPLTRSDISGHNPEQQRRQGVWWAIRPQAWGGPASFLKKGGACHRELQVCRQNGRCRGQLVGHGEWTRADSGRSLWTTLGQLQAGPPKPGARLVAEITPGGGVRS